jgi:hypothetical protein
VIEDSGGAVERGPVGRLRGAARVQIELPPGHGHADGQGMKRFREAPGQGIGASQVGEDRGELRKGGGGDERNDEEVRMVPVHVGQAPAERFPQLIGALDERVLFDFAEQRVGEGHGAPDPGGEAGPVETRACRRDRSRGVDGLPG